MFYHLGTSSWATHESVAAKIVAGRAAFPELFGLTWSGFVGVEIFFVISGFVIAYSAADASALSFLRSRIVRLYPAVWICSTVSVLSVWSFHLDSPRHLLHGYANSLVLFPYPPWADAVYWTLGIEMVFYACIFCLLALNSFRRIRIVCYLMGAASAAYWLLGAIIAPSLLSEHLWNRRLELSLVSYGIYFALGILLYSARNSGFSKDIVAFGVVLMIAAAVEIHFKAAHNNLIFHSANSEAIPIDIFFIAMIAMVASLSWNASAQTARAFHLAGLMTYPLYLIHDNFGAVLLRTLVDFGFNRFVALGITVLLCLVSSFIVAAVLEPPIQELLRKIFNRAFRLSPASNSGSGQQ